MLRMALKLFTFVTLLVSLRSLLVRCSTTEDPSAAREICEKFQWLPACSTSGPEVVPTPAFRGTTGIPQVKVIVMTGNPKTSVNTTVNSGYFCDKFPWLSSCATTTPSNKIIVHRMKTLNATEYCSKKRNSYNANCLKLNQNGNQTSREFCTFYYNKCKNIEQQQTSDGVGGDQSSSDAAKSLFDWKAYCNQNTDAFKYHCLQETVSESATSFCRTYINTCPAVIITNENKNSQSEQ